MIAEIRELFEYNRWANARVLDAVSALSEEAITRDLGSSFPSVLSTLSHLVGADWIWLRRWTGESPEAWPDWDISSLDAVRARWSDVEGEREAFLAGLDEEAAAAAFEYQTLGGKVVRQPLEETLRHVVNHSTYHRGQLATLLRQVGAVAPSTDLVQFYREKPVAEQPPPAA